MVLGFRFPQFELFPSVAWLCFLLEAIWLPTCDKESWQA